MKKVTYLVLILSLGFHNAKSEETCESGIWEPDNLDEKCTQQTKQKAMYGTMTFEPSLKTKPMTSMRVGVEWNVVRFNPCTNPKKNGGIYISYTMGVNNGPGGYFGVQISGKDGQFIFSIWDYDRMIKVDGEKKAKIAGKLAWPVDLVHCKRNCQDCGVASLAEPKALGLTTGTKCTIKDPEMKEGDRFIVELKQLNAQHTINTADYEGFKEAHETYLEEFDRSVTGGLWEVLVTKVSTGKVFNVGKILFEGDGSGMNRLGTFDEMIGCNRCNSVQHKDTRYGPVITAADGSLRNPTKMQGRTKADASSCKNYFISGSKSDHSISFEGGPLTKTPFPEQVSGYVVWD